MRDLRMYNLLGNAIHLVLQDLKRHEVDVILKSVDRGEEQSMYLIIIKAKTSMLQDFEYVFGDKLTDFHKKIAKKIFTEEEADNDYGLLINKDLRMTYAFNMEFAHYDSEKKEIAYIDPDKYLFDKINSLAKPSKPPSSGGLEPPSGGGMMIRYSLTEKEEVK